MVDIKQSPGFSEVDQTSDPQALVQYLESAHQLEAIRMYKKRMLDMMAIQEGDRLLEIGCGTGEDACELSLLSGTTGRVVGVDKSMTMLLESQKRTEGRNVSFCKGDAESLGFPDAYFDACRADRVLHHVASPQKAIDELIRVSRVGARIVLGEPDFTTLKIQGEQSDLTDRILQWVKSSGCRHPDMGSKLSGLCEQAGLVNVQVEQFHGKLEDYRLACQFINFISALKMAVFLGQVSFQEAKAWHIRQLEASETGNFACSLTGTLVCAYNL